MLCHGLLLLSSPHQQLLYHNKKAERNKSNRRSHLHCWVFQPGRWWVWLAMNQQNSAFGKIIPWRFCFPVEHVVVLKTMRRLENFPEKLAEWFVNGSNHKTRIWKFFKNFKKTKKFHYHQTVQALTGNRRREQNNGVMNFKR